MRLNSEAPSSSPALTAGWICSSLYTDPPPHLTLRKNRKTHEGREGGGGGSVHRLELCSKVPLVNNQLVCLRSVGMFNSVFRKCITSISVINTAEDKQKTL